MTYPISKELLLPLLLFSPEVLTFPILESYSYHNLFLLSWKKM